MPKGTNQKFKLYRLAQIMLERTDDDHYITMPEIKISLFIIIELFYLLTLGINLDATFPLPLCFM